MAKNLQQSHKFTVDYIDTGDALHPNEDSMAILRFENGTTYAEVHAIDHPLIRSLQIEIGQLPLRRYLAEPKMSDSLQRLLDLDILNLAQKQEILQSLSTKGKAVEHFGSCIHSDLMIVNLASANLYQLLSQGSRPHVHSTDQVLYLLAGECIIGLRHPNGYVMELMLRSPEYIKVPAGIRHWFSLSASLNLKAVRYFTQINEASSKKWSNESPYSCNITD